MRAPALFIAAALACALSAGEAAAREFVEIKSDHFAIRADVDEADAKELALSIERSRAAMLAALFSGAEPRMGRVSVVALRDAQEFSDYADPGFRGFATMGLAGERLLALHLEGRARGDRTLEHEVAHAVLDAFFQRQPRWIAEGFATLLETIRVEEGSAILVGTPPQAIVDQLLAMGRRPLPVRELRGWRKLSFGAENRGLYASSWLLVHWLLFSRAAAFAEMQKLLARAEDPSTVLQKSLPDLDDDQLDLKLREWLDDLLIQQRHPLFKVTSALPQPQLKLTPLSEAEGQALRAMMTLIAPAELDPPARWKKAAPLVARALELEPTNVTALLASMRQIPRANEALLARMKAAAAAHPNDFRAHLALAQLLGNAREALPERLAELQKAARLSPFSAPALVSLAAAQLDAGDAKAALPMAAGGATLAPSDLAALEIYAIALARTHQCDAAQLNLRRARDVLPADDAQGARHVELLVEHTQKECAGGRSP